MGDEHTESSDAIHVISVSRRDGVRGIFIEMATCSCTWKKEPFTDDEMHRYLGPFALILKPQSMTITHADMADYLYSEALAEYQKVFGISYRKQDLAAAGLIKE